MSRSLDDLDPGTRVRVRAIMAAMEAYGYPLFIVRTYDPLSRQAKLFAQGRTAPGNIVTKVKRGWHNLRKNGKPRARAVDFAFKKQKRFPGRKNFSKKWPWDRIRKIANGCDMKKTLKWDLGHMVDSQGETFSQAWRKSDGN